MTTGQLAVTDLRALVYSNATPHTIIVNGIETVAYRYGGRGNLVHQYGLERAVRTKPRLALDPIPHEERNGWLHDPARPQTAGVPVKIGRREAYGLARSRDDKAGEQYVTFRCSCGHHGHMTAYAWRRMLGNTAQREGGCKRCRTWSLEQRMARAGALGAVGKASGSYVTAPIDGSSRPPWR